MKSFSQKIKGSTEDHKKERKWYWWEDVNKGIDLAKNKYSIW